MSIALCAEEATFEARAAMSSAGGGSSDVQFGKHWCRYCRTYVHNSALAIRRHEEAGRHKRNVRESHRAHQREQRAAQREARDSFRQLQQLGASVGLSLAPPPSSLVGKLATLDRVGKVEEGM